MILPCKLLAALILGAGLIVFEAWGDDDYSLTPPDTETLAASHDGNLFMTAESAHVRIWDAKSGGLARILGGHRQPVVAFRFSADDKLAYSLDAGRELIVHDASSGAIVRRGALESPHRRFESFFTICERAGRIVEIARDGWQSPNESDLIVHDISSFKPIQCLTYSNFKDNQWLQKIGFTPNGTHVGYIFKSGKFILYDLRENRLAGTYPQTALSREGRRELELFGISADLKRYVLVDNYYLKECDLKFGNVVKSTGPIQHYAPRQVRYDPSGRYILADLYIFNAENGAPYYDMKPGMRWDFFPDGGSLLMLQGGMVSTLNLAAKTRKTVRNYNTDAIALCRAAEDGSGLILQTATGRIYDFGFRTAGMSGNLFSQAMGSNEYRKNRYLSQDAKYAILENRDRTDKSLAGWDIIDLVSGQAVGSFAPADFEPIGLVRRDDFFLKIIPWRGALCLFALCDASSQKKSGYETDSLSVVARDVKTGALRLRLIVSQRVVPYPPDDLVLSPSTNTLVVVRVDPGESSAFNHIQLVPVDGSGSADINEKGLVWFSDLQERNGTAYYIRDNWPGGAGRNSGSALNRLNLTNRVTTAYAGPAGKITGIAPNRKNSLVAAAAIDGVFVWEAASARPVARIDGIEHTIYSLCFSNDDRWLFAAGANSVVYLIDARTWKIAATLFLETDGFYGCVLATGQFWSSAPERVSVFFEGCPAVRKDTAGVRSNETAVKDFLKSVAATRTERQLKFPAAGVLNDNDVRVRDRPGLKGNILGHLQKGERVTVLEVNSAQETVEGLTAYWYKIKAGSGLVGWSFGAFIDIEN